jgi:hypothetical protein
MPIAEIIAEIDEYLSRLRSARELLLDRMTESPQKRVPPRRAKVANRQARPYSSSRRRADESKSQSNHPIAHLKRGMKRADAGVAVPSDPAPGAVGQHGSLSEKAALAEPERAMEKPIAVTRVPARKRSSSIKSVRPRTTKPESGTRPDAPKPAIALAGPVNTKIVVVSAEQMQRERERAAVHSEVRRPRRVSSGLSGRLAFEALFQD